MPFFDEEDANIVVKQVSPEDVTTNQKYFPGTHITKTSEIYSRDHVVENILHQLGGFKLPVTYFLQLVDPNDAIGSVDTSLSTSARQYQRIDNLTLFMTSAITQDIVENVEFEAVIDVGLSPTKGDVVLFMTGLGREALFELTKADQKHFNNREVYSVTFKLINFIDTNPNLYNDLILKTVYETVYDSNFLSEHSSPVLTKTDYLRKITFRERIPELINHYLTYFIHKQSKVIALPTDGVIYTDTLLTEFLFKVINVTDNPELMRINRLDVDLSEEVPFSIWDVLSKRDIRLLPKALSNVGFSYTPYNMSNPLTRNISYLNINFIVDKLEYGQLPVTTVHRDISIAEGTKPKVLRSKEAADHSYVLSRSFYNQETKTMSQLELLLFSYLKNEKLDITVLETLLEEYPKWTTLEQFYFIPILILLTKDALMYVFKNY